MSFGMTFLPVEDLARIVGTLKRASSDPLESPEIKRIRSLDCSRSEAAVIRDIKQMGDHAEYSRKRQRDPVFGLWVEAEYRG